MRRYRLDVGIVVAGLSLYSSACKALDPNKQIMTKETGAPIAPPSQLVAGLLAAERSSEVAASKSPLQVRDRTANALVPGRAAFLSAMGEQLKSTVPPRTYVRLIEDSGVRCGVSRGPAHLPLTTRFIKIRVTSGPLRGQEGWVCENDLYWTVTMP